MKPEYIDISDIPPRMRTGASVMNTEPKPRCAPCRRDAHVACTKWLCSCEVCFPKRCMVPPLAQNIAELGNWNPTPAQADALLREIALSAGGQ